MRRSLLLISCCLLGAGATTGVAWLSAMTLDLQTPERMTFQAVRTPDDRIVNVLHIKYFACAIVAARVHDDHSFPPGLSQAEESLMDSIYAGDADIELLPVVEQLGELRWPWWSGAGSWTTKKLTGASIRAAHTNYLVEQGFGWPFTAIRCTLQPNRTFGGWDVTSGTPLKSLEDRGGISPGFLPRGRVLPVQIAAFPFLLSSLLYGCVVLATILCVGQGRRLYRGCRGRCRCCGYDLRGQQRGDVSHGMRCPECGSATLRAKSSGGQS